MEVSQKASIWKRIGVTLRQCGEAMDYGIYDIVEEHAKRINSLERDVTALRAEVELLREQKIQNCSAENGD